MPTRLVLSCAAAAALTLPFTAHAQAPKITPIAPTWCAGYTPEKLDLNKGWVKSYWSTEGLHGGPLGAIGKAACDKPADPERQKEVAEWRQHYHDFSLLSDEEGRQVLAALMAGTVDKELEAACTKLADAMPPKTQPAARARTAALQALVRCERAQRDGTLGWWLDEAAETDEISRTVWVRERLRLDSDPEPTDKKLLDDGYTAGYAMAGRDARALDRKRFEAELKQAGITGIARLSALESFGYVKHHADHLTAVYRARAKADAAFGKLVFDVPEAAWKAWEADAAEARDALAYERAFMAQLWAGTAAQATDCSPRLRTYLGTYAAKRKPKTEADAKAVLAESIGYRLTTALLACEASAGNTVAATTMRQALESKPPRRGPRMHVYFALLESLSETPTVSPGAIVRVDDDPARLVLDTPKPINFPWVMGRGQIASLAPHAAGTLVTFKTTRWSEAEYRCVTTNRIDRIENGSVVYKQDCTKTGKVKAASSTEKPVVIAKLHAAGLKVGDFLVFNADGTEKPARGAAAFGFSGPDQKQLVSVFGVRL